MEFFTILVISGLVAGGLHVVAGPDHLAALAPIAINNPRKGLSTGALWGLGHGIGVALLSATGLLLRNQINIEAISTYSEIIVGFLLLVIGGLAIRQYFNTEIHSHNHLHEDGEHSHLHHHPVAILNSEEITEDKLDAHTHSPDEKPASHSHAALGIGMLHGSAGTGHLFGVLPSLALEISEAIIYLAAYFISALLVMSGFGLFLGQVATKGGEGILRRMLGISGVAAVIVGLLWIISFTI